jgi:hypothetical protein
VDYLGFKELQKFNKCITSLITDFEQATLAQVSDKWKPITLADGAFNLMNSSGISQPLMRNLQ